MSFEVRDRASKICLFIKNGRMRHAEEDAFIEDSRTTLMTPTTSPGAACFVWGSPGGALLLGSSPSRPAATRNAMAGGTLTIGADADPIGLDPTTVTAFSSFDFIGLIYTGLLRWNADMKIEPDLALSYERPDATTYVFKLRQGVKFHNGQDFTAEDVKYTFDRILDPATASRLRAQYSGIKAVTVIDPLHREVRTQRRPTRHSSTISRRTRTERSFRKASTTSTRSRSAPGRSSSRPISPISNFP